MKRVILAAMAVGCALFCMCAVAHAETYKGTCAALSSGTYSGSIEIEESGECTIKHPVAATGAVSINATGTITVEGGVSSTSGGNVTLNSGESEKIEGAISAAGGSISADAESGNLAVLGNITTKNYGIVLRAYTDVALQNVEAGTTSNSGAASVRIFANEDHSGSEVFTVGIAGLANGVGYIYNNNKSGGGQIYITNGGSGGIRYSGTDKLQVNATAGPPGAIYLDSRSTVGATGPVYLSGELSVSAAENYKSGNITIMAPEIKMEGAMTLQANDSASAPATHEGHFINFATGKLNLAASLTIFVRGVGDSTEKYDVFTGSPVGSIAVTASTNPAEAVTGPTYPNSSEPLTVEGAGKLSVYAEGKNNSVGLWGNPLKVGKAFFNVSGSDDEVWMDSETGWTSPTYNKLSFEGEVEVWAGAEEAGQTPGKVYVRGSEIAKPSGGLVWLSSQGANGGTGGMVELVSTKGEVFLGTSGNNIDLDASATESAGNAGTVNVSAGSAKLNIAGDPISASVFGGNGNGGNVIVTAGSVEGTEAHSQLSANGHGTGTNGKIEVHSENPLSIGSATKEIEVDTSNQKTSGGHVELSAPELHLNGQGVHIAPTEEGNAGELEAIISGKLIIGDEYSLEANGAKNGNGGIFSLTTSAIELGPGGYTHTIRANGAGSGEGGHITFEITGSNPLPTKALEITANGGESGKGGKVFVTNAPNFDVNKVISVNGGTKLATTEFDGSISLNEVLCQQWLTGAAFPKSYWNCAHPTSPEALDKVPASVAEKLTHLTTTLETNHLEIYVFESAEKFSTFWSDNSVSALDGGITFNLLVNEEKTEDIYTAPFESGGIGGDEFKTYTEQQYEGVAAHELGHAIDIIEELQSQEEPYTTYALRDLANLDYAVVGTTKAKSTVRLACKETPGHPGTPPFEHVKFLLTGEEVCISGALNKKLFTTPEISNSLVLQIIEGGLWATPPELYSEAYAQTFSYQDVGAQGERPMMEQVWENGYFKCMKAWANALLAGKLGGPSTPPDSCETTISWYKPFQAY